MINTNSKIAAFIISLVASLLSWVLIFLSTMFKLFDFSQFGLANIGLFGFAITTIIMNFYTFFILFKIKGSTYFPLVLMFFHFLTLTESYWLFVYLAIDIVLLILLNNKSTDQNESKYYQYNRNDFYSKGHRRTDTNKDLNEENVFDAEFTTIDEDKEN